MNDSLEKLALSCTFSLVDGRLAQLEGAFSGHDSALSLQPDFLVDSKYRVSRLIGKGGMGAVYKVHHELLLKDMALKTICTRNLSSEAWQRFQREAQSIAKLRHENIVEVFDFGISQGELPYYTMELLQGESLAERLARLGPCDPALALNIFIQVADAMAHAHRQQIVHRDIKPANIFLAERYGSHASQAAAGGAAALVKIVDFGIAKLATGDPIDTQYLTTVGTVFGSPLYMSPEQSMGVEVDQRSDIYSFGCSLFHALAGRPPFVGENAFMTLMSHQGESPPAIKNINASCQSPQRLDSIVQKLLAKDPDERFQTFEEVHDELSYCLGALQARELAGKSSSAEWQGIGSVTDISVEASSTTVGGFRRTILSLAALAMIFAAGLMIFRFVHSPSKGSTKLQPVASADAPGASKVALNESPNAQPEGSPKLPQGYPETALSPFPVKLSNGPSGSMKTFGFPPGDNYCYLQIGTLENTNSYDLKFPPGPPTACSGPYSVPTNAHLCFFGKEGLSPEFIRRFRPDDIYEVQLDDTVVTPWTPAHIEAISRLRGLRSLKICNAEFKSNVVPSIDKLVNLKELKVSGSDIRGTDLAKLAILPQLQVLEVSLLRDAPELLRSIPASNKLWVMFACNDGLQDDDMPHLARFTNLGMLGLQGNDKITVQGLKQLAPLSKLGEITLSPLGPESIEPLSHFHNLKRLRMDIEDWSSADRLRLKKALPGCNFMGGDQNPVF